MTGLAGQEKKRDDIFSRFDAMHERVRHADGHTPADG